MDERPRDPGGLPGPLYLQISDALIDAFSVSELAYVVRIYLGRRLEEITLKSDSLTAMVAAVLDWADRHDRVADLVAGAKLTAKTNRRVQALPTTFDEADAYAIRLTQPRAAVAQQIERQIRGGQTLLDEKVPASRDAFYHYSGAWHRWRKMSEQILRTTFSTLDVVGWFKQLNPTHQTPEMYDLDTPVDALIQALRRDIERDMAWLAHRLALLGNYAEPSG